MDLLLGNLGKAGVLLAVTAMLFSLKSWLLEHDQGAKVNFTWDVIGGTLERTRLACQPFGLRIPTPEPS
jgi:hypothetical protein